MSTVKIGVMPGKIEEFALATGSTVGQALEVAGLDTTGFEVKVDGNTVSDLDSLVGSANVILLTKKVKGNATVKIGVMPGKIEEYVLEEGTSVAQALETAGLSAEGYEVKADGNTVTDLNTPVGTSNVILLTKKVKGNSTVKIGVMPGKIEEYALEAGATVKDALNTAGLDSEGFEVKVDGNTTTDLNSLVGSANVILLTKKVKGN